MVEPGTSPLLASSRAPSPRTLVDIFGETVEAYPEAWPSTTASSVTDLRASSPRPPRARRAS